jgi:hypothetical protein
MNDRLTPLIECGIIVKGGHDFGAEAVIASKKDAVTGEWSDSRCCHDYRQVNELTPKESFILPLPEQLYQEVGDACIFSKIDLQSGFFQVAIPEELQYFTGF